MESALKSIFDRWPFLTPLLAYLLLFFALRRIQEKFADEGIGVTSMRGLYGKYLLVRPKHIFAEAGGEQYAVRGEELLFAEPEITESVGLVLKREDVLDKTDWLTGSILSKGLLVIIVIGTLFCYILGLDERIGPIIGAISFVSLCLGYALISGWAIEVRKAVTTLRSSQSSGVAQSMVVRPYTPPNSQEATRATPEPNAVSADGNPLAHPAPK